MSGHFLLAPIPESSSDYLLPKDIKLAVLGAGRVGKSGECGADPRRRAGASAQAGGEGTGGSWPRRRRMGPLSVLAPFYPPVCSEHLLLGSGLGWRLVENRVWEGMSLRSRPSLRLGRPLRCTLTLQNRACHSGSAPASGEHQHPLSSPGVCPGVSPFYGFVLIPELIFLFPLQQ